jgi:glutaredoxin
MKPVPVDIFIENECPVCEEVLTAVNEMPDPKNYSVTVHRREEESDYFREKQISIVPAIFLNDTLFCYGSVNTGTMTRKINQIVEEMK